MIPQTMNVQKSLSLGVRYALKSRSSNCYLNGNEKDGEMVTMSNLNPQLTRELHWELIQCDEGYFAVKNISNGGYLDGRNESYKECLVTHRQPNGDVCLMWKIEECEGFIALRCKSNGYYLDGRAAHGQIAFATGR